MIFYTPDFRRATALANIDSMKECHYCYVIQPLLEFHIARGNIDGHSNKCRQCQKIYARGITQKRRSTIFIANPSKAFRDCSDCAEVKSLSEFSVNPNGRDGFSGTCKSCTTERSRAWHLANPGRRVQSQRKLLYDLSAKQFSAMITAQNGQCAICKCVPSNKPKSGGLHVDHCHSTGKVRGLLCYYCNTGLGQFKDDPDRLRRAIEYLNTRES